MVESTDEVDIETINENIESKVAPTLDMQDLYLALNLINTAIKRGTYEPHELTLVGKTYEKIKAFLQYQSELQAANQEKNE